VAHVVRRGDAVTRAEFWARCDQSGGPEACWPWTGATNAEGYGTVRVGPVIVGAHVLAFETFTGKRVKPGRLVRHSCDNPPCINPRHLVEGTHGDNLTDQYFRNRRRKRGKLRA